VDTYEWFWHDLLSSNTGYSSVISPLTGVSRSSAFLMQLSVQFLQGPNPRPITRPRFSGPVPSKFGMENPHECSD
jgi:hypothetical protein